MKSIDLADSQSGDETPNVLIAHGFDIGSFSGCKRVKTSIRLQPMLAGSGGTFLSAKGPTAPVCPGICDLWKSCDKRLAMREPIQTDQYRASQRNTPQQRPALAIPRLRNQPRRTLIAASRPRCVPLPDFSVDNTGLPRAMRCAGREAREPNSSVLPMSPYIATDLSCRSRRHAQCFRKSCPIQRRTSGRP
jgi:hypothetical protein